MATRTKAKEPVRRRKSPGKAKTPTPKAPEERTGAPKELKHFEGCPEVREVDGEKISAVETYTQIDPKGREIRVTRCTMCGEAGYETLGPGSS